MANFQRDGNMAFKNQGARPNYLSSIEPISVKNRTVDLDKVHGHFIREAVSFLSEIRPEDFVAPRALWEKVMDEPARERFINNVSGHIANCSEQEIIKRQIAIFREVSDDIATRLEKATGVKGYDGIKDLTFNGSHNGMTQKKELKYANGLEGDAGMTKTDHNNGAPVDGMHKFQKLAI